MGGSKGEDKAGDCEEWSYQFGNKDTLILKAPKKSPLPLRMVVFSMTMICGVFICSMCMKQLGSDSWSRIVKIEVAEQPCNKSLVPPSEVQFVHYPQPQNYSRKECMCTPVRFFAIISSQRSGSGWFETLLNSHVNVSSNGEIFSNKERRNNISSIIKTMDNRGGPRIWREWRSATKKQSALSSQTPWSRSRPHAVSDEEIQCGSRSRIREEEYHRLCYVGVGVLELCRRVAVASV